MKCLTTYIVRRFIVQIMFPQKLIKYYHETKSVYFTILAVFDQLLRKHYPDNKSPYNIYVVRPFLFPLNPWDAIIFEFWVSETPL
uniref:Uncharacterized protein n=1 Tax=Arundo donax TaxID=35708 RepID=A0A0A9G2G3_ARUDO